MFNRLKNFTILPVDFTKPWWYLAWQQKWLFLVVLSITTLTQVIWSLVPFIAAKLFEAHSFYWCILLFTAWFFIDWLCAVTRMKFNTTFQLQCIHSIYQNAYVYLLTVDPHYHIHRSSGSVLAKIERAARGYEDFLDHITFEVTPLIMGLVTVIISLAYYSLLLASVMTCFIVSILAIGYYFAKYKCQLWENSFIASDDAFKSTAMENLTQIQLIRATFASNFRNNIVHIAITENMSTEASLWFSYSTLFTLLGSLYIVSLFVLAMLLIWYMQATMMTAATALGLFLVYVQSSKEMVRFARVLRKITHSTTAIKDLFAFIPTFGKETFPVLGESLIEINKVETITITASNIYFDYGKAMLFNDHTCKLVCSQQKVSKLYGIIGPSGSGKTTLLSILGGQLKPIKGNIVINGIDIYTVNDAVRSQLIALQGQVASNMRGTIKNNLLLGLPEEHGYTDQDLLHILEQVGLLIVLQQHDGLATMLGEGGLNLSGGQRQRLNFAGLYLRAHYYKPLLVLIDEPTSSLDELSEAAITNMIETLAKDSVTLVVAHRLKTIQKAVGIIDLSLLHKEKAINAYTSHVLQEHSHYYKELIQGKIQLDH